jgi:class 3 adenylate cyclase
MPCPRSPGGSAGQQWRDGGDVSQQRVAGELDAIQYVLHGRPVPPRGASPGKRGPGTGGQTATSLFADSRNFAVMQMRHDRDARRTLRLLRFR